jgi:rubrerythrin
MTDKSIRKQVDHLMNPIKKHLSFLEELKHDLKRNPRNKNKNKKWWKNYNRST